MDQTTRIDFIQSDTIESINEIIDKLPKNPKEIAVIAATSGETIKRLACCVRLLEMYRDAIPIFQINASEPLNADKKNSRFEKDLTINKNYPNNSLTTLFTCVLYAIGPGPAKKFRYSPSSPNPFVQCVRIAYRLTLFLRIRYSSLNALYSYNQFELANTLVQLNAFPELAPSSQRAALYSILQCPNDVDLRLFSYCLPRRYITDSSKKYYSDFVDLLTDDRKLLLEHLEKEIEHILNTKETDIFFSATSSLSDSLAIFLTYPISRISKNKHKFLLQFFLHEISPIPEIEKFHDEFDAAVERASKLSFAIRQCNFTRVLFVLYDVEPQGKFAKKVENTNESTVSPDVCSLFRPKHDYIADTRRLAYQ